MTGSDVEPTSGMTVEGWTFEEVDSIQCHDDDDTYSGYAVYDGARGVMLSEAAGAQ